MPKYNENDYSPECLKELKLAERSGLCMTPMLNPLFNAEQLYQIRQGLLRNLDASKYANPKFDRYQMVQIRYSMEQGYDVSPILDERYSPEQMGRILRIAAYGFPLNQIGPEMHYLKMNQICKGLEQGLDVSIYANNEFSLDQMNEIRIGLRFGIDVLQYSNPAIPYYNMAIKKNELIKEKYPQFFNGYSEYQTEQLLLGYIEGVDVTVYSNPDLSSEEMSQIRFELKVS